MSVLRAYVAVCDECGREEVEWCPSSSEETGPRSKRDFRAHLRQQGWQVGRKATPARPSQYDVTVDICQWCQP